MHKNSSIRCDVTNCKHNAEGQNCELQSIMVTCGCGTSCTCCGSYAEKDCCK